MNLRSSIRSLAVAISITFAVTAHANLLIYEPFNYPVGALSGKNGGMGFADAWSSAFPFMVQSGSLGVGSYQGTENMGLYANSEVHRHLAQAYGADSTELWMSVLLRIDFMSSSPAIFNGLRIGSASPVLFIGLPSSTSATQFTTWGADTPGQSGKYMSQVPIVLGQPALLVVHMTFLPGPDQIDLYVNPIAGSNPAIPDVTITNVDLLASLQTNPLVYFWQTGSLGAFDELRMGTTYADVVQIAGDFDGDGVLTQSDLTDLLNAVTDQSAWANSHNLVVDQMRIMGDVSRDGSFDNADIQALINKLINPSAGPVAVPEPSTLALAAIGLMILAVGRRRSC